MDLKKTNIGCFMAVPDLISLLNLSFGFLAILMAINNQIFISSTFIIIALIFDSLDGWVARKLSRVDNHGFGKNIDSLSDIVSFGVAPGILLYCSGKIYIEILGLSSQIHYLDYLLAIISLFVVICGVLRLTRFNVIAEKIEFNGFIGVPIPTAGIILASFILTGFFNIYLAMFLMIIVGFLMISNIRYSKLNNPKILLICAILVILTIAPYKLVYMGINIPATIIFIMTILYIFMGIIKHIFKK